MNSRRAIRTVISAVVLLIGGQRSTANDETSGFAASDAQILDDFSFMIMLISKNDCPFGSVTA